MSISDSDDDLFIPIQYGSDDEIWNDDLLLSFKPKITITKETEKIKIVIEKKKKSPKKKKQLKLSDDQFLEKAIRETKKNQPSTPPIQENKVPNKQPKKGLLWKKLQEKKAQARISPKEKSEIYDELGQAYIKKKNEIKKSFIDGSQQRASMIPTLDKETEAQIEGMIAKDPNEIQDYVYEKMNKTVTNMTKEIIDYSLSTDKHILDFVSLLEFERNLPHKKVNASAWEAMCGLMYKKFNHKTLVKEGVPITEPTKFYEEMLKQYVGQGLVNAFEDYLQRGIFNDFKPEENPMVFFSVQKDYADVFPELDMIVSLRHLIAHKLVPSNAMSFNPFKQSLLGFAVFWSFSFDFNLFGGFFRSTEGKINFYWIVYKRLTENMEDLLISKETKDLRDAQRTRKVETPMVFPKPQEVKVDLSVVDKFITGLDSTKIDVEQKTKLVSTMQNILGLEKSEPVTSY